VVAVVEAEVDWVQRVARDMFLSLTDTLVFSSLAERKTCSLQRTWFLYVLNTFYTLSPQQSPHADSD